MFLLGTAVGSFLNVLIDRLPKDEKITGRSHCDYCKKKLSWYDLIPVISFFLLQGRCRYCYKKLSWQYPLVEIITGITFVLIFSFQFSIFNKFSVFNFQTIILFGLACCLLVIFFSDLKYHLISDYILLTLFVLSIIYHLLSIISISLFIYFFISSLIVALPIFLIYYISHERAMGLGDVYLSAIMGFLLGWKAGFVALYIAFVTGAIIGMVLILLKKKKIKSKVPFGPFIVIGTVVMLFWGEKILEIIKRIYGF